MTYPTYFIQKRLFYLSKLIKMELLRLIRNPVFALSTIGFPIFFFAIFGLPAVNKTNDVSDKGQIILVSFATYSLLTIALISFGTVIAAERKGGWLKLLRTSPMPTAFYLCAKIVAALLFSALSIIILYTFAHFTGGVTLSFTLALVTGVKLLLGLPALIALGLAIGFILPPQTAQIAGQFLSVIMAFASGIFIPLNQMPKFVRFIAPFMPSYHLGQISIGTITRQPTEENFHWLILGITTIIFGSLAVWGMKNDENYFE